MKILFCDDHTFLRESTIRLLFYNKIITSIDEAINGKVAIEMMKKNQYDLVILDIRMPVMGGMEALAIMKKNWPDVPVVMHSSESAEIYQAVDLGASGYILKGIDPEELFELIDAISQGKTYFCKEVAELLAKRDAL